jgi:hypothetical protein
MPYLRLVYFTGTGFLTPVPEEAVFLVALQAGIKKDTPLV